jgi:hypothetical protein
MRRGWTWGVIAVVVAGSLVVGGCGDDDSEDEDAIVEAIENSAASGDPAACTESQTQAFTEQTTGETGEAAIKQCERDAEDSADDAEVSNLEIDGDSATADVTLIGSFFDGQTLSVGLISEGGEWLVDELTGFPEGFDLEAFRTSFTELIVEEEGAPPETADCVVGNLEGLSDEEIEAVFIDVDPELEQKVFGPCFEE